MVRVKPGKCSAGAGKCPFGADAPHYGTKREGRFVASPPLCLRAGCAGPFTLARLASFLAAYLWRDRERGGVRGCHCAVSITARESVCWLVGRAPLLRDSVFRAFGF